MREKMNNSIFNVDINQEMRESYLQYSMSVIVGRALPDVRDGLKPVHRRILFAMKNLRNTHDKPYKKSARVVGDVIGKYHPHGDTAVYDSIVRMAQDFSMQHPLIDGQGNFGSIDGDAPAASRYTEVRMTPLAEQLLEDIDKETVPFGWNYDDTLRIPQVLPSRYPNLLVNGSEGIAVGMASRVPPHNLGEVISACVALIQDPTVSDEKLMEIVPGPDFPTAGTIKAQAGLISAYKTGKGIITIQAKVETVQEKGKDIIVVQELPYQVNKARLIENIATLVKDKRIEGISDIRDESSREGMRVVIVLKRKENADVVLNQLFKHTSLRSRFGIIFLALDRQNQPRLFSLKQMLRAFIEYRFNIVTKRLIFDLKKARIRAHILEGLKKALDSISEVIKIIRLAKDVSQARSQLMENFELSREQAQSVLDMRLQKLTSLEREKILQELKDLLKAIDNIQKTLSSEEAIYGIIEKELIGIKERFSTPRKTVVISGEDDLVEDKELIAKEDVLVTLNSDGGIKRISLEEYRLQKRGGSGLKGSNPEGEVSIWKSLCVNTHSVLLVLTDRGRLYWLDAFRIPQMSRTSKGRSIRNLVWLQADENVQVIIPVNSFSMDKAHLCLMTKKGVFKKSSLQVFSKPRKTGVIAVGMDKEDQLVSACISVPGEDIFLLTRKGFCIRFPEESVRSIGRTARGVRGISLRKGDAVISMDKVSRDTTISYMTMTEMGYGKRTSLKECRSQKRGGMGIMAHKVTERTGEVVCAHLVEDFHQILVMTNQGQSIRFSCKEISTIGRSAQGVRLMKLKKGEKVRTASLLNEVDSSE
ncbi:MAG: DNA gyrase subunit A [Bdellovibrionales bacterium]|nr:DNA gyrase subunit A [Bdellovibrionales bacterium]